MEVPPGEFLVNGGTKRNNNNKNSPRQPIGGNFTFLPTIYSWTVGHNLIHQMSKKLESNATEALQQMFYAYSVENAPFSRHRR